MELGNRDHSHLLMIRTEDKARKMERGIFELVEESCMAFEKNDTKAVSTTMIPSIMNDFDLMDTCLGVGKSGRSDEK